MVQPGLWEFAVAVYSRPGVEHACLVLQDSYGLDVDVLLFAVWLGARGESLGPVLDGGLAISEKWQAVIGPLRATRRALKAMPQSETVGSLRAAVKAAELSAEHAELDALEVLAGIPGQGGRATAEANLRRYFSALNIAADLLGRDEVLRILDAAFPT